MTPSHRPSIRHAAIPPELSRVGTQLLNHLDSSDLIPDSGCGDDRDVAWFEDRHATIICLDLSAGMLTDRCTRRGCPLGADALTGPVTGVA